MTASRHAEEILERVRGYHSLEPFWSFRLFNDDLVGFRLRDNRFLSL